MGEFAIGQSVSRFEDPRLLKGGGRYVDDMVLPGMAFGYVLRSPHAHARIRSIDTASGQGRARRARGAHRRRLAGVGLGRPAGAGRPEAPRRQRRSQPPYPALVKDRVRWVGDYVAFVVAETAPPGDGRRRADRGRLRAAAGRDLDRRGGRRRARRASGTTAPTISASCSCSATRPRPTPPSPRPITWSSTASSSTGSPRPPWSRAAAIGDYNPTDGRYTIYTTLQRAHPFRADLAPILKVPESKIRVVAGDIGGSFGMKSAIYNEVALVLLAVEAARPAGQVDQHALGGVPQRRAGARQRHRRRARARQGRHTSSACG